MLKYAALGAAAMALAVIAGAGTTVAGEPRAQAATPQAAVRAGASSGPMVGFYAGSRPRRRRFRGKIVCLRCDLGGGSRATCAREGHRHALLADEGAAVYPLLADSPEMLVRINSAKLHGREVTARGRLYPESGAVIVDAIAPVILAPIWGPDKAHGDQPH